MLTTEQLTRRQQGIGASEVPAVLGLDTYRSPLDVYLEKTGALPAFEGNRFTEWGNRLEPVMAAAYADERPGVTLIESDTLAHPAHPWALATPDRICAMDTRRWLLECKNRGAYATAHFGEPGTDQVPDAIAAQCHWQMFVTGLDRCDVAVLLGGNDFRVYELARDGEIETRIVEAVHDFWFLHVQRDVPPDARASDAETVKRLFPSSGAALVEGTPDQYEVARMLAEAKAELKELEDAKDQLEAQLKLVIGEGAGITWPDGSKATWKSTKASRKTDWQEVAALTGATAEQIALCTHERPGFRRFLLSLKEVA